MRAARKPDPRNVSGDFYVEAGCCTRCEVPDELAPDLFAAGADEAGTFGCFVSRQPASAAELTRMLEVVQCSEMQCVRYRGTDPAVLRRLAEMGETHQCDAPPPAGVTPVFRNHVEFRPTGHTTPGAVAAALAAHLRAAAGRDGGAKYRVRGPRGTWRGESASLSFAWFEGRFHAVRVRSAAAGTGRALIVHSPEERPGSRAVSGLLHKWLTGPASASEVRWFAAAERNGGAPGTDAPW